MEEAGELCEDPIMKNCSTTVFDQDIEYTLFEGTRVENMMEYTGRMVQVAIAVVVRGMKEGQVMVAYVTAGAAFAAWA